MERMIFPNLPVADLKAAERFYLGLGFTKDPQFSNDDAAAMVISDSIVVMLLQQDFYQGFLPQGRPQVYARVQAVHAAFVERCGTISCAELLRRHPRAEGPTPEERTPAYYASRPCARVILQACRIIEEQLGTC